MANVNVQIPGDLKEIIGEIDELMFVEAVKTIAKKKLVEKKKKLKEYQRKIETFESKYGKNYSAYSKNVPDTQKGHDDWIEWTYLHKTADKLISALDKITLLIGT